MAVVNVNNIILLCFSFSFFQLNFLPIGRFLLPLIFLPIAFILIIRKCKLNKNDICYFVCFLVLACLITGQSNNDFIEYTNAFMKIILIYSAFFVAQKIDFSKVGDRKNAYVLVNVISITLLLIDAYVRFSRVGFSLAILSDNFYIAKKDSIILSDTNGVGFYIACVMSLNIFFKKAINNNVWVAVQCVLFILTLLTMSRSAIFSISLCHFLLLAYWLLNKFSGYIKLGIIVLVTSVSLIFLSLALSNIIHAVDYDASGASKIKTFYTIYELFGSNLLLDFFGRGLHDGGLYYSFESQVRYAHSGIPLLLGFFGIFGSLIYLFLIAIPLRFNGVYYAIFTMFFFIGLSYLEVLYETLFLVLGLAYNQSLNVTSKEI